MPVSKAMIQLPTKPHALYRFYDQTDVLLYVGISAHLPTRVGQHKREKPWWIEVRNIAVEYFGTRHEALDAEADAIRAEKPLYNSTHNELTAIPDGVPEVVTWTPHGPRTGKITVEWMRENWGKVPKDVRDFVEIPALDRGCVGMAEDILGELADDEAQEWMRRAQVDAAADDLYPELADNEAHVLGMAAVSAFLSKGEDVGRLETAVDHLFEKLPVDIRDFVLDRARSDVEYHQGPDHSRLDITCWAVFCLAYAITEADVSISLNPSPPPRGDVWNETPPAS